MNTISVIIPCYNPSELLFEAVASVYAQTRPAQEVLLVNDGSKDAGIFAQVRARFPETTIVDLPENKGVAHARNEGLARARGDYITFLDQDDFWAPEKTALQAEYLDAHPECEYVTSKQRYFLAEGLTPPNWVKPEHLHTELPGFLPGTLMARKTAFEKIGTFNEILIAGTDDVDWFFRAAAAQLATHCVPQILLHKRIHSENLSKSAAAHNKELLSVVRANLARRRDAKISVVIPCYNAKDFIAEAIASVVAQGDIIGEILVVDDASTDGSADFVETLQHTLVRVIRLPQNKGIGGARNAGIAQVQHPYIAFLDADDLWPEGRCRQLMAAMQGKPWAFGGIEHFAEREGYALPPVQTGYFASAMLVRSDFLREVGVFDETLKVGEFIDWFDRAKAKGAPPAVVDSIVLNRRIHGNNSSIVTGNRNVQDYLKVARAAIARKKQGS